MAFLSCFALGATDIYVDYEKGQSGNSGSRTAPLARFQEGLKLAKAGDTVYILPASKPVRDQIRIKNFKGGDKRPITIDGMLNTFIGTKPVSSEEWKEIGPGLYHKRDKIGAGMRRRYTMFFDGVINRMGLRTKFGGGAKHKNFKDLAPGEWTINGSSDDEADFYFRLPQGKTLQDISVEEPRLASGINISGECEYITVRNMILKNFLNDGVNIHHNCRNILFENIASVYNTDDGISAHESCHITLRNFVAIGNSTGICHLQDVEAIHENVYIAPGTDSRDIYMLNKSNKFQDMAIESTAPGAIVFDKGENTLQNCYIILKGGEKRIDTKTPVRAVNVSVYGAESGALPEGFHPASLNEIKSGTEKIKAHLRKIFGEKMNF